MLKRALVNTVINNLEKQKVSILLGARRVGKTQVLEAIKKAVNEKCLWLNGEDETVANVLAERRKR